MVTFISFSDTSGRIGRIQWTNTAPGASRVWGSVEWDTIWPARPTPDAFSEMLRRIAESAQLSATQMAEAMAPVLKASAAIAELGRAIREAVKDS